MSPYIHEAVPHRHKRVRFSPNGSSEPSVSDLASTTGASSTTNASDYGSDGDSSDVSPSSDEPSDDSSSSEEDEDEGEDTEMEEETEQDGVVILRANRGKKPVMKLADDEDHGPDIRSFLKDFLPKLKESNEELERQRKAGTLKSLDDGGEEEGEPYIEMDLGLGVLEEKDPNKDGESESGSDTEDGGEEKDVLGKLLKREKKDPAKIEVVRDTTDA